MRNAQPVNVRGASYSNSNEQCRHNLFERIAWTYALNPIDQRVLQALATFGNFRTGRGACPSVETLAERCRLNVRTVKRATFQLKENGYITKTKRRHNSSVYNICLDKLAVDMNGTSKGATSGPFNPLEGPDVACIKPLKGPNPVLLKGPDLASDPSVRTDPSVQYDPSIQADPSKEPTALRAEISTAPPETPPPIRSVIPDRRNYIAKVLRRFVMPTQQVWPDHKDVTVALIRTLQATPHQLHWGVDYGPAALDDAIAIVNTATPFIGVTALSPGGGTPMPVRIPSMASRWTLAGPAGHDGEYRRRVCPVCGRSVGVDAKGQLVSHAAVPPPVPRGGPPPRPVKVDA